VQLSLTPGEQQIREEIRAFLDMNLPTLGEMPFGLDARVQFLRDWQHKLHEAGLVGLAWPTEYGGRGATPMEQIVANNEMARAGAPEVIGSIGLYVVGPSIIDHGTAEQKAAYIDRILSAEDIWCQGFSEPGAGSDLASLQARAVDKGDHFVLTGQKTWTSYAQYARWCAVLARTDDDAKPHRSISYLIVDLQSPGVEVRPLVQPSGDAEFGEIFFDEVVVPKENLLGPLNGGWGIAMHTLAHERGSYALSRQVLLRTLLDGLIADARTVPRGGAPALQSPEIQSTLARAHIATEVLRQHGYRSVGRTLASGSPGFEASVDKVLLGRVEHEINDATLAVLGAYTEAGDGSPWGVDLEDWYRTYFYGRAASVYGGTVQIQYNIIAERILGLPRSA
jgi:alkylation response protein AidB-like acyl-CoA dehydrogenase